MPPSRSLCRDRSAQPSPGFGNEKWGLRLLEVAFAALSGWRSHLVPQWLVNNVVVVAAALGFVCERHLLFPALRGKFSQSSAFVTFCASEVVETSHLVYFPLCQ